MIDDVKNVISSLSNGKAPVSVHLLLAFYKAYSVILAPSLLEVQDAAFATGTLPLSML